LLQHGSVGVDFAKGLMKTKKVRRKVRSEPKGPLSGLKAYRAKRRSEVRLSFPDLSIAEVTKTMDVEWSCLSDADQAPYLAIAKADSERYKRDSEAYEAAARGTGGGDNGEERGKHKARVSLRVS
jgi:hypothetical protein